MRSLALPFLEVDDPTPADWYSENGSRYGVLPATEVNRRTIVFPASDAVRRSTLKWLFQLRCFVGSCVTHRIILLMTMVNVIAPVPCLDKVVVQPDARRYSWLLQECRTENWIDESRALAGESNDDRVERRAGSRDDGQSSYSSLLKT